MERYSWAVGIDEDTGLITVEDARLSVSAFVTPTGAITSRSGLVPAASTPGNVTATSPTPNGFVHVSPFRAVLQSGRGGGTYIWCLDEVKSLDVLTAAPADPANPRIVLVVWQQSDTFFSDSDSDFEVKLVAGAPAGVPVDPAVPGSTDYIVRARITVPANATTIDPEDIQVLTLPWTVATGGVLPIRTQAERDAITAPFNGMTIDRLDKGWRERHDGTAWRAPNGVLTAALADITHPVTGQYAFLSTDNMLYRWTGAAWVGAAALGGTTTATRHRAKYFQNGTAQTIPNVTQQRLSFNANTFTTTDWTTSTVSGGTKFTCAKAGSWEIKLNSRLASAAAAERGLTIANDAFTRILGVASGGTQGSFPWSASVSVEEDFDVGDDFCCWMYQASGGGVALDLAAGPTSVTMRYKGPKAT